MADLKEAIALCCKQLKLSLFIAKYKCRKLQTKNVGCCTYKMQVIADWSECTISSF